MLNPLRVVLQSAGGLCWLYAVLRFLRYQAVRADMVVAGNPFIPLLDMLEQGAIMNAILFGLVAFFVAEMVRLFRPEEPWGARAEEARHVIAAGAGRVLADEPGARGRRNPRGPPEGPARWTDTRWGWRSHLNGRDLYLMEAGAGKYRLWLCFVDGQHVGSCKTRLAACAVAERAASQAAAAVAA
ncbi:hypothetical protein [Acuticoccus yangtzensis]|uniref:hypothetical protein n=1 Tax=Acuticoccus yangtzensis TaxID=1443441 RepID=UPI0009496F87|nr:hypothetical protein [Acuticoccus yangtzensis]